MMHYNIVLIQTNWLGMIQEVISTFTFSTNIPWDAFVLIQLIQML